MKASNSQKTAAAHTSSPSERTNTLLQEDHPAKKRQRTRQACDECRREKTKCDGNQPCAHCLGYGYHCSYDHLSPRKIRKGESQLAERKLRRLQELLKSLIPDIDVDDPNLDVADLRKALVPPRKEHSDEQKCLEEPEYLPSVSNRSSTDEDPVLETILELTGRLDIDEHGNWDYLGHSSGSLFLRRLGEQFCGLHNSGSINKKNLLKLQPTLQAFETFEETFSDGYISILTPLPPKETALDLVSSTLDDACALINFVHQPSFYNMFHRMYDVDFEEYGHREKEFLPLLYAVLAVGYVFSERELMNFGNAHSTSQGAKYFQACKRIFDLSGCHNLPSLQAVVFMIIFLQSSGNMSTCYTYIGTALAASLQMGLHRRDGSQVLDPVERESRKRIFWTIRNMEIYVVAILGLPMSVNDEDIDQEEPLGVDDEFITKEGITTMPEGRISIISAFNAHTKLIRILEKVVRDVYPIRHGIEDTTRKPSTYIVSDASVRAVEAELEDWEAKLPVQFRVGSDASPKLTRIQHLLRMALTHVRMVLYRPFLHYTSRSMMERPINERCRVYASASVAVGRNIIENVREMGERSNFSGPYWFSIYTIFFATISLSFHAWENAGCEGALKMLKDAECGRDMLAHLAHRSMSAARCSKTLEVGIPTRFGLRCTDSL
ncbi:fungal-specific transcription factor domain-containing protein [Xylogone sp. PMI_703]|nr:fungal-specific transcription factor domain-containing protein [Xylogone sp. PMI_703]